MCSSDSDRKLNQEKCTEEGGRKAVVWLFVPCALCDSRRLWRKAGFMLFGTAVSLLVCIAVFILVGTAVLVAVPV